MNKQTEVYIVSGITVFFLVFIDQITKTLFFQKTIPLTRFFSLTFTENSGIAFGFFPRTNLIFIGVTLALILLVILFYVQYPPLQWSFNLIVAGAIGNLIDRIRLGYVIDFIDVYGWPVFNVADALVVIGGILLFIKTMQMKKEKEKS